MNFPRFHQKGDVLTFVSEHKPDLSEADLERLARLYDALPDAEAAARIAKRRRTLEGQLVEAWRASCRAASNEDERRRRMAEAVARMLGDGSVFKARRIYLHYVDSGIKPTNRCLLDVASRPGFSRAAIDERFRALDKAVASMRDRSKRGRVV